MKKLPIYNALITTENTGLQRISLVESPAVLSNFLAFDEDKQEVKFAVQDEEKREVLGVVMRADFPIYRCDSQNGEYYVKYGKETIKLMSQKMLSDGVQNKVNLQHQENSDVKGVEMFECFIKDTEMGVSPKGFENIEDGSLFARFKVNNDDVWNGIKDGDFRGFSLEGLFVFELEEKNNDIDEIIELLNKILN